MTDSKQRREEIRRRWEELLKVSSEVIHPLHVVDQDAYKDVLLLLDECDRSDALIDTLAEAAAELTEALHKSEAENERWRNWARKVLAIGWTRGTATVRVAEIEALAAAPQEVRGE